MPKISVDKEKCIGCGACVAMCPKSFKMVENKAVAVKKEVPKISCENDAAESCPVQAITITG
jgi:ferredoxin